MSDRTAKINTAHTEVLTVIDLDGQTPVTGLTESDFTVSIFKDGVADTATFAITEISGGNYRLHFSSGFDSAGYWVVTVLVEPIDSLHRYNIEASNANIDDLYQLLTGAAVEGITTVTFTVENDSAETVQGVTVAIYNELGTTLISTGVSDTNGEAVINLPPASYKVKTFLAGYNSANESLTVTNTGTQSVDVEIVSLLISPPPIQVPSLCKLYIDFLDMNGEAAFQKIAVTHTLADTGSGVVQTDTSYYETDDDGHIEFNIIQDSYITVTLIDTGFKKTILVPEEVSASLSELLGIKLNDVAGNNTIFQVVE